MLPPSNFDSNKYREKTHTQACPAEVYYRQPFSRFFSLKSHLASISAKLFQVTLDYSSHVCVLPEENKGSKQTWCVWKTKSVFVCKGQEKLHTSLLIEAKMSPIKS